MPRKRNTPKLPFEPLRKPQLFELPGVDPTTKKWGDYDPETGEYVINRPDTPQPWYNYLTNGQFTSYISHTGGGTCFYDDAQNRRILRTHIHSRPIDQPGRWVYIRDRKTGRHWSATWAPTYDNPRRYKYECRVGAGYNIIKSAFEGIETSITYFVPPDANGEVWSFEVTNSSKKARTLDIFPYAEFILWSQTRDMNLDAGFKCTDVVCDKGILVHRSMYDFPGPGGGWRRQYACLAASEAPRDFDMLMDAFVGAYNGYDKPRAVVEGRCSNYLNRGGHPCAAMRIPVSLRPGKSKRIELYLGYGESQKDVTALARRCTKSRWVDRQFKKLKGNWKAHLDKFQAQTGSPAFDVPFNTFSAVQCAMTFLLSRSISPYQLSGSRGLGFRDSIQDTLGSMAHQGANARKLIATLLTTMRPAGDSCHTFFPAEARGQGAGFWDDHLWPALATSAYVRETGDLKFLSRKLPYWESKEKGTVLEHLDRAFRFAEKKSGKHGLPLLGYADWNDCLNAYPGAESVFTACLYCYAAREVVGMYEALGDERNAARIRAKFKKMASNVNRYAWDGKWYARLILKDGSRVGSHRNKNGKIFIESNVWAVMSGVASPKRAKLTLDSVRRHLGTPYGFRLCVPPYPDWDPDVGSISVFPPGLKENGSIFCHTNPWVVCAEAELGRGNEAFDVFARLSPWTKNRMQHVHAGEPYVVSQMIAMPPNIEAGRAKNAWLTGTASWFYVAMAEAILGVRPDFGGLRINPCVPGWKSFSIQRLFRGALHRIKVRNPKRVQKGVVSVTVDGRKVRGNLIPAPSGSGPVDVDVLMG